MTVLVINCGSSSIKYKLYGRGVENLLAGGIIEGVGGNGRGTSTPRAIGPSKQS